MFFVGTLREIVYGGNGREPDDTWLESRLKAGVTRGHKWGTRFDDK